MKGLLDYQIRILNQDRGGMFVPMSFYKEDKNGSMETEVGYDFSGMISLREWLKTRAENLLEVLDAMEKIFLILDKCKEILIDYEDLEINIDRIFVSTDQNNQIKLQFAFSKNAMGNLEFEHLVHEAASASEGYAKEYLEMMANRIHIEKPGLTGIITLIGRIKREVYICGWIGKSRAV